MALLLNISSPNHLHGFHLCEEALGLAHAVLVPEGEGRVLVQQLLQHKGGLANQSINLVAAINQLKA